MAKSSLDLPDPLDSAPRLSLDNADDLISELAGQDIDRLIGPDEQWRPEEMPRESHTAKVTSRDAASVEDLAAELDQVFEQIRTEQLKPPPVEIDTSEPDPITLPEPVLAMRKYEEPELNEMASRRSLLDPIEDPPLPMMLRPMAWINAPVAQLAGKSRLAINVVSIVSFVGSIAALIYVLKLRQGL